MPTSIFSENTIYINAYKLIDLIDIVEMPTIDMSAIKFSDVKFAYLCIPPIDRLNVREDITNSTIIEFLEILKSYLFHNELNIREIQTLIDYNYNIFRRILQF